MFRFYAQPVVGAVAASTSHFAYGVATMPSGSEALPPSSGIVTDEENHDLRSMIERGAEVEVQVSQPGSRGLGAALLWMYPGMYLASSGKLGVCFLCCLFEWSSRYIYFYDGGYGVVVKTSRVQNGARLTVCRFCGTKWTVLKIAV